MHEGAKGAGHARDAAVLTVVAANQSLVVGAEADFVFVFCLGGLFLVGGACGLILTARLSGSLWSRFGIS